MRYRDETQAYILHRLKVAGCEQDDLFDSDAVPAIFEASDGVPRLINTLCDTALTACMLAEEKKVTTVIVSSVIDEFAWGRKSGADRLSETAAQENQVSLKLEIEDNGKPVGTRVLSESGCVIGRASDCGITIDSKYLSQYHAIFSREGALWQISDLNSTNGTYLNSSKIRNSMLEDYDIIDLGTCRIHCRLVIPDESEQTGKYEVEEAKSSDSKEKPKKKKCRGRSNIRVVK